MARHEEDREDLLREATALSVRMEIRTPCWNETVLVGFRRNGAASFDFGADPVYHFNTRGQLRRGYRQGVLLKAEQGRLVELVRQRQPSHVSLVRRHIPAQETLLIVAEVERLLRELRNSLRDRLFVRVGQVPDEIDVCAAAEQWFATCGANVTIADGPQVG